MSSIFVSSEIVLFSFCKPSRGPTSTILTWSATRRVEDENQHRSCRLNAGRSRADVLIVLSILAAASSQYFRTKDKHQMPSIPSDQELFIDEMRNLSLRSITIHTHKTSLAVENISPHEGS
jgi:hypothetical protein